MKGTNQIIEPSIITANIKVSITDVYKKKKKKDATEVSIFILIKNHG
jgi:hypothetical protein